MNTFINLVILKNDTVCDSVAADNKCDGNRRITHDCSHAQNLIRLQRAIKNFFVACEEKNVKAKFLQNFERGQI